MTAPSPSRADPRRRELPPRDADSGLITLEWLLIVGAIAGLAASSVLIVQSVVDNTSEAPVDPLVRLLEADVAAAFVAAEAQSVFDDDPLMYLPHVDAGFASRCQNGISGDFSDVVDLARWFSPADPDGIPGNADDVPARCVAEPRPGLGA